MEYQFEQEEHEFVIQPHGNRKKSQEPYKRTQKSTIEMLQRALQSEPPRIAIDVVRERHGGITKATSSAAQPRNIEQTYNIKKTQTSSCHTINQDPYMQVILQCKEQAKDPSTQFIQHVKEAPKSAVVLATQQQLKDVIRFGTNPKKFCIFQVDETFNLGDFSVTSTTYEHLFLINKRSKTHPAMIGPLLVHQKRVKDSYKILPQVIAEKYPEFQNLRCIGTDGEKSLVQAYSDICKNAIHLRCFIHFKRNIEEKLKSIGIDEGNRKQILFDLFGKQIGSTLEEGIVDCDNIEEFTERFNSLKDVWFRRNGNKGTEFHHWFESYKPQEMSQCMLKSIRISSGLGDKAFTTNRIEAINSILKLETERKKMDVMEFVNCIHEVVKRQERNIEWAVIGKTKLNILSYTF